MRKKLLLTLTAMVMMLAMAMFVSGAATSNTPTDDDTITGLYFVNITPTFKNTTWCNLTLASVTSGHSFSFVALNGSTDGLEAIEDQNVTISSSLLPDAIDYTLTGSCQNGTSPGSERIGNETLTEITGIKIENTIPTCTYNSLLTSDTKYAPTQIWTITSENASTGRIKFGSNAYIPMVRSDNVSKTWTFTHNPLTGSNSPVDEGVTGITVETKDGTNATTCSLSNVNIDAGAPEIDFMILQAATQASNNGGGLQATFKIPGTDIEISRTMLIIGLVALGFIFRKKLFGK